MDKEHLTTWLEFLNPDVLRPKLISAAVYVAAFEVLKNAIVDEPRSFFSDVEDCAATDSAEYRSEILSRNRSPVHASLAWLREQGAITDEDLVAFDRIKTCRNRVSHSLVELVASAGMPPDFGALFDEMIALLRKISVWWVKEVHIPVDPEFDGIDIPEAEISPGRVLLVEMLRTVAMSPDESSHAFCDAVKAVQSTYRRQAAADKYVKPESRADNEAGPAREE